jgi:peptidylprolyl isomerase/FKBP-type peptidyl-prolyl cis-trans isomerase FkpA
MKKGILLVLYVVLAAVIIGVGSWYANNLTQSDQPSTQSQTTTQNQNNTMDGLVIKDEVVGTGTVAAAGDTVTVNYTGTLDDGTKFDSSLNPGRTPFSFVLGAQQVIKGWDEGVAGMKIGGTRDLTIPPALGYGAGGAGSVIPPNATLHFVVTLLSVSSSNAGQ